MKYLQKVDLSTNKLKALPKIGNDALYQLNVDENEIANVDFFSNKSIRFLSMNKNKLTHLGGFTNFKSVEELNLQENEIVDIAGLSDAPCLKKVDLSNNKIESLDAMQGIESLTSLNLDGNPIAKIDDLICLNKHKNLEAISMNGTAIAEEKGDELKKEIIIACEGLLKLKSINGEEITPEDIEEAMALKEERRVEAEAKPEGAEQPDEEAEAEQDED